MRLRLELHSDSRCDAVTEIAVEVLRPEPGGLGLRYLVTGKIGGLILPPVTAPARADSLWRHTCFEAFLRAAPGGAYYEVNLAPSRRWAAYRFEGYRDGMRSAQEIAAPLVEARSEGDSFELRAGLNFEGLPGPPGDGVWRLGLSAVIEEAGGRISYWALAHPPGKPDFHHSDCFALELPAAWRP